MFRFLTDSPFYYFKAFTDSSQKDLLKVLGNIPVRYQGEKQHIKIPQEAGVMPGPYTAFVILISSSGRSYNIPVQLWLLDSFPFTPPICFLRPTASMMIREGKHVDAKGRIHLPALHNWDHVGNFTEVMFFYL